MDARARAALVLVCNMLLVALVTVLAKQTLADVPPITFTWTQMIFAIAAIGLYTRFISNENFPRNVPLAAWLIVVALGLCNFSLVRTFFILSLDLLPVTTHAYLINFVGIFTMALSAMILQEKASRWQFAGALIALAGVQVYFAVWPSGDSLQGVLLVFLAVFFLALTNILMRLLHIKYPGAISPNIISMVAIASGSLPIMMYGLATHDFEMRFSVQNWIVIAANGIFAVALTMSVFNYAMARLKAYEASILASSGLVFAAIFSVILLNERISVRQLGGIVLLLSGIAIVQFTAVRRKAGKT